MGAIEDSISQCTFVQMTYAYGRASSQLSTDFEQTLSGGHLARRGVGCPRVPLGTLPLLERCSNLCFWKEGSAAISNIGNPLETGAGAVS
jgi:hypothetical protein